MLNQGQGEVPVQRSHANHNFSDQPLRWYPVPGQRNVSRMSQTCTFVRVKRVGVPARELVLRPRSKPTRIISAAV